MPTRLRKNRRMKGTRTVGYGQIGQHRSHPGGRGKAGLHKYKWSWITTNDPDYFGVHGFRPPSPSVTNTWLNVGDLEALQHKLSENGKLEEHDGISSLNLTNLGIEKLLGGGKIGTAFAITVSKVTEKAKEKVESAGGKIQEA